MRTIVVHQPHFLPWLGYFNKLAHSAVFVILDDVNFRRGYFQNRTKIFARGSSMFNWFTLPIQHPSPHKTITDAMYCSGSLREAAVRRVNAAYEDHPYFRVYWPEIFKALMSDESSVVDMNVALLRQVTRWMGISSEMVFASTLTPRLERTERLIAILRCLNAEAVIFGEGNGTMCHDTNAIESAGFRILYQDFTRNHPVYEQPGAAGFVPGLSVLDALMCVGAERTRRLICDAWSP